MCHVLDAKFSQNQLLAVKLVETAGKTLVEATVDKYWGANATINSKSIVAGTWKGANRLGIMLMAVRSELLRERGIDKAALMDCQPDPKLPSIRPTPPTHGKKRAAKRANDVLSPPKLPPAQHVRIDNSLTGSTPHAPALSSKSPNRKSLVPPVTDLFACPSTSDSQNQGSQQQLHDQVPLSEDLFACSSGTAELTGLPKDTSLADNEHTVYIGSQPI